MIKRALHGAWSWIRSAPGTYIWLVILFLTTVLIRNVSPETANKILEKNSTNLHYLAVNPVRVLITSAFWIWGAGWYFYAVLYTIFHAPAERWLGTWRWLTVALTSHVGATYLSEGVLYWAIHHGYAKESAKFTLDYGVSYALAGVVAVLTYRIAKPWRYIYCLGVLLVLGSSLVHERTFTSVGHFSAVLIGLAFYPFVAGRPVWDPVAWVRGLVHRQPATVRADG